MLYVDASGLDVNPVASSASFAMQGCERFMSTVIKVTSGPRKAFDAVR